MHTKSQKASFSWFQIPSKKSFLNHGMIHVHKLTTEVSVPGLQIMSVARSAVFLVGDGAVSRAS